MKRISIYGLLITVSTLSLMSVKGIALDDIKHKNYFTHSIDAKLWPLKHIRWPSTDRKVHVYFDKNEQHIICPKLKPIMNKFYADKDKFGNLDLGEYCKKLIVLFNEPRLNKLNNFKEFIAAHEAFHIAAQFYGGYIILENMFVKEPNYKFLSDFVVALRQSFKEKSKYLKCKTVTNYIDKLTNNQRIILLDRAMLEWPAEYYSKQVIFGDNDKDYYKLRYEIEEKLSEEDPAWTDFYTVAHDVIEEIEKADSSSNWKIRVTKDETVLDVYLKQNNCKTYSHSFNKVRIFSKRLDAERPMIAHLTEEQEAVVLSKFQTE